jgi:hypothetical protein
MEQAIHVASASQLPYPIGRNGVHAICNPGQTAGHTTRGVGVAAEIDSFEYTVAKIF